METQARIEQLIDQVESLPGIPHVAFQVNQMLDDPSTTADALAQVIMMDPALTIQVLKLCNSAQYGFSRKIATISEAVSILGSQELRRIIVMVISHSVLNRPVKGYGLEKGELWRNALTGSFYAKKLAQDTGSPDPELAYVAALLRDIGKIALDSIVGSEHRNIETQAVEGRLSFADAEEAIVGVSHAQMGEKMAQKWNLPDALVTVIGSHHWPSHLSTETPEPAKKLTALVHLADSFTLISGAGVGNDGLMYPLDIEVLTTLGIEKDQASIETLYSGLLSLHPEIEQATQALLSAN